ncbi:MAG: acylneuraminate cytidylyltransferase family protein [Deltaproteobacteria bacterium]|nr:acylneuraminate cytidylyltransferase family protein [Deltaproteobacteria bacterium]
MCPIVETDNTIEKAKPKVLAIIPARGGSKGVPRKNIRKLCGKPLIAYSIEVALKSKLIDRVVVSTEDEEIAEISKHFGAEVPFLRPKEMAQDHSSIGYAINFTLNKLKDSRYFANILVALFPTHPFRTPKLVDFLVSKTLEGYSPVNTVKLITHTNLSIFSKNRAKNLTPLLNSRPFDGTAAKKAFFRSYGLFSGTNYGCFDRPYLHVIKDSVSLIDIDSLSDFFLAEEVIKEGLFDFG